MAPWSTDAQLEQDLVVSRALVEVFRDETLREQLAFRGGTALHKVVRRLRQLGRSLAVVGVDDLVLAGTLPSGAAEWAIEPRLATLSELKGWPDGETRWSQTLLGLDGGC